MKELTKIYNLLPLVEGQDRDGRRKVIKGISILSKQLVENYIKTGLKVLDEE